MKSVRSEVIHTLHLIVSPILKWAAGFCSWVMSDIWDEGQKALMDFVSEITIPLGTSSSMVPCGEQNDGVW
jgi:hypothetical protein